MITLTCRYIRVGETLTNDRVVIRLTRAVLSSDRTITWIEQLPG